MSVRARCEFYGAHYDYDDDDADMPAGAVPAARAKSFAMRVLR